MSQRATTTYPTGDPGAVDRFVVAVDVVLLSVVDGKLRTVLVRRGEEPFSGDWALPGVAVRSGEALEDAAARALADKARLNETFLEQLYTFGIPDRDPRSRAISVSYYALVPELALRAALDESSELVLAVIDHDGIHHPDGRELAPAFDHARILATAVERIRGKLDYSSVGFELLPRRFPLRELQAIHETILGQPLNKDSFRRRMITSGRVRATGVREVDTPYRPAELYEFAPPGESTQANETETR
ncbi:MAG: Nudix-related transcriptional regulator NrtR [Thermoleophilia bacterium]|nr:Nudix-related transcriptional regulator NrtR [Thermoleophilia bacterium]